MNKLILSRQLALNLTLSDDASFDNFYHASNNANALQALHALNTSSKNQFIYIYGSPGVGRSHIAMACCRHFGNLGLPVSYLSLRDHNLKPEILDNLENMFLLCLDDLNAALGKREWENALFYCFNRLFEVGGNLLVTANTAPSALNFLLPDLKSRMCSGLIFQLQDLDDEQKLSILDLRAKLRGLRLSPDIAKFLLTHYQRDLKSLFSNLEKLSKVALNLKHQITIPFIKNVLGNKNN